MPNHPYIGVLPADWRPMRLDKVVSPDRPIVYEIVQAGPHVPNGVPYIKSTDVGGIISLSSLSRTSNEIHQRYKRAEVRPGDLVFSLRGDIGQSSIVPTYIPVANLTQGTARISVSVEFDVDFVRHVLAAPSLIKRIASVAKGSSFREVSLEQLRELEIPSPPLTEQRRIAEILRTWDKAIDGSQALISQKLLVISWLRAELLTGRKRLPGFRREWKLARLDEILTEHKLRSTGQEEVFSVSVHKALINQVEHLGRSFSAKETWHYNRVMPGDIVYTKSPTGDFPLGIIKQSTCEKSVIVSPLYGVFSPTTRHLGVILDAIFESPVNVRNYLNPLVQKGAKNTIAITNKRFLEGHMKVPTDISEQAALAGIIEAARSEVEIIQREIGHLNCQKRGLMQKLLTGQWRTSSRSAGVKAASVGAEAI